MPSPGDRPIIGKGRIARRAVLEVEPGERDAALAPGVRHPGDRDRPERRPRPRRSRRADCLPHRDGRGCRRDDGGPGVVPDTGAIDGAKGLPAHVGVPAATSLVLAVATFVMAGLLFVGVWLIRAPVA